MLQQTLPLRAALQPFASAAPALSLWGQPWALGPWPLNYTALSQCLVAAFTEGMTWGFLALFDICKLQLRAQVQLLKQDDADHFFFFEAPSKEPYLSNAMPWGPTKKLKEFTENS